MGMQANTLSYSDLDSSPCQPFAKAAALEQANGTRESFFFITTSPGRVSCVLPLKEKVDLPTAH